MNPNLRSSGRVPQAVPPTSSWAPWSYIGHSNDTHPASQSERTPLLPHQQPSVTSLSAKTQRNRFLVYFALIAMIIFLHWRPGDDALNPPVRNRIRREWDREIRDHEKVRMGWEDERREINAMREQLLRDRETWAQECEANKREEERRRKEAEDRVRAGFAWDGLKANQRCLRHDTRQYTARISNVPRAYDPIQACAETAVEIRGLKLATPHRCEDRGCNGVIGHWIVDSGEASCATHFDHFKDKGCTTQGSGLRRIESHLEDLRGGDDWRDMCSTTPADFLHLHFDGPHMCVDWGKYGIWGIWEIEDHEC